MAALWGGGRAASRGPWGQLPGAGVSHGGSGRPGPLTAACGVGELAAAGPSCAAPAFPALIYSQARSGRSPGPAHGGGCCHGHGWEGDRPPPKQGRRWKPGMEQRAELQPVLLHSPVSQVCPPAEQAPSLIPKPVPQLSFGGAGKTPPLRKPPGLRSWGRVPERAASLGWRGSASEESTCFQAQGNWSTLSFRCL